MSYDAVVEITSLSALILFVVMALGIAINAYRPSKRDEMERMARLPLDCDV